MKFKSTSNKGFQITFSNDITISVQFGQGNYCLNKQIPNNEIITECEDAEIAIWQGDEWYNFGDDTVKGWVSPDEVAEWIEKIQKIQNINQL